MRDAGLQRALAAGKGVRPLARALGMNHQAVGKWPRVPQDRVFQVARATGVAPEILRPDLADWIRQERGRQRWAAARERFSLVKAAAPALEASTRQAVDQVAIDVLTTLAATRFVAAERALGVGLVIAGRKRLYMGARSWAMGLAHVAGGASSTVVGLFFETSRQNIDNASERYLRARDGDDPEDFILGNDGRDRVIERGRLRPAKTAQLDLWSAEARFKALLQGDTPDERKRA
jgi:hypothetical protein